MKLIHKKSIRNLMNQTYWYITSATLCRLTQYKNLIDLFLCLYCVSLSPGSEAHHRPVRGSARWPQPHFPAGGALWRNTGESFSTEMEEFPMGKKKKNQLNLKKKKDLASDMHPEAKPRFWIPAFAPLSPYSSNTSF